MDDTRYATTRQGYIKSESCHANTIDNIGNSSHTTMSDIIQMTGDFIYMTTDERKQMLSEMVEDGLLESDDEDVDDCSILNLNRRCSALQSKTATMKKWIRLRLRGLGTKEKRSFEAEQARHRRYLYLLRKEPSRRRLTLMWFADRTNNAKTKNDHAARLDVCREMRLKLRIASEILQLPMHIRKKRKQKDSLSHS